MSEWHCREMPRCDLTIVLSHFSNREPGQLFAESYFNVAVMFASLPNYIAFFSDLDDKKPLSILHEIISKFDQVGKCTAAAMEHFLLQFPTSPALYIFILISPRHYVRWMLERCDLLYLIKPLAAAQQQVPLTIMTVHWTADCWPPAPLTNHPNNISHDLVIQRHTIHLYTLDWELNFVH